MILIIFICIHAITLMYDTNNSNIEENWGKTPNKLFNPHIEPLGSLNPYIYHLIPIYSSGARYLEHAPDIYNHNHGRPIRRARHRVYIYKYKDRRPIRRARPVLYIPVSKHTWLLCTQPDDTHQVARFTTILHP